MAINDNITSATVGVPSPPPPSINESGRGVWTEDEHNRFLDALQHYPNGPWRLVAEHVGTRSVRQVQTHAQKYHEKVARRLRGLRKDRRLVQRSEHRIDSDMLEICHELTRDSVPLPPRVSRSPHITGILQRPAARTDSAFTLTSESKQEEDQDEELASSAGSFVPWGGASHLIQAAPISCRLRSMTAWTTSSKPSVPTITTATKMARDVRERASINRVG